MVPNVGGSSGPQLMTKQMDKEQMWQLSVAKYFIVKTILESESFELDVPYSWIMYNVTVSDIKVSLFLYTE